MTAVTLGFYEVVERTLLRGIDMPTLDALHILRVVGSCFLVAVLVGPGIRPGEMKDLIAYLKSERERGGAGAPESPASPQPRTEK